MQKIFILLKTVVSIIFLYLIAAAASASTILIDSLTYTIDPDGTASVTQCNKTHEGSLSIPSSFEFDGTTYSVIAIEAWAFSNCSLLTEVITPESITTIGEWAFSSSSITNITLGENITSIGNYAFDECPNLNGINVNENNSFYKDINGVLFSKDGTLLIQYPMGKTDSSYSIPERVVTIGNDAFRCCDSLSEIIIPDSVIEIGEWAFDSCKSLKYIAIPNSVIRIGTGCFNACTSLTHITIPDSVISIGNSIFYDCTRLSSVSLGNGITEVKSSTFYNCFSLKSVILGNHITQIGNNVFRNCSKLAHIYFKSHTPPTIGTYTFINCPYNIICYYPQGSKSEWGSKWLNFNTQSWNPFYPLSFTIVNNTALISDCDTGYAGAISIPSFFEYRGVSYPITSIGYGAFSYCSELTEIVIHENISSIEEGAFSYCTALNTIRVDEKNPAYKTIEDVLYSIDGTLLHTYPIGKTNVSYTLPDSVIAIGNNAFTSSSKLAQITIGNGISSIGDSAFSDCSNLTEIYFKSPAPPLSTGIELFYNCSNIVIYYPEVFEANWDSSWQGFPTQPWTYPLTYTINDDETVSVVDCDSDYSGSVQIPSHTTYEGITRTVTSVKSNAFSDCPLLIDLIIPDTISMIEDEAFAYSSNLSGIYFKSHIPPSIGNEAFSGCPSNMILYYPEGSENEWPSSLQDFPTQSWNSFYPLTLAIINDTATIIDCAPDYSGIVTIPASIKYSGTNYNITSIEADAFLNSPLITRFYVDKDQAVYKDIEGILFSKDETKLIQYPSNNPESSCIIPNSVSLIGKYAFSNNALLTEIYFQSENPPSIETNAFYNCLNKVIILYPNGFGNNWGSEWEGFNTFPWNLDGSKVILSLTIDNQTRFYNTENPILTYNITETTGTLVNVDGKLSLSTDAVKESNIGEYEIYITENTLDNNFDYDIKTGILNIIPIPLTVAAEDKTRPYKTENPELTYLITDETGTEISVDGLPELSTPAELTSPIGKYPITAAQGSLNTNYTYTFIEGTLTVTPIPLTVAAEDKTRPYKTENPELTYLITDETGTEISVDGLPELSTAAELTSPVGEYPIAQGTLDTNYTYKFIDAILTITYVDPLTYTLDEANSTASVTDCETDYPGYVIIPSTIERDGKTYTVTSIGDYAFWWCTLISEIIIPEGIITVGNNAFSSCTSLTEIIFPDSVISIGEKAFYQCSSLTSAYLGSGISEIGEDIFIYSPMLNEILDKEGVLYSKDGTLLISYPRGKSDKSYTIPDEVTEIAANAFFRCDNLTQIIMPENITTIGDKAFYNFPSLNEIYFKSIAPPTDLGGNMFLGCSPHIIIYYPTGFEYSWGPTWLGFKTQPWGTFEEATIKILKIETNHETGEINLTLIFTGILEESTDGISWLKMTEVQSPYTVTIKKNQNRLFRSKFKWSASLSNSN